jgi:predicted nucleotidyltransferase
MEPHHIESIARVRDYFAAIPETQALLLVGSIAHGFESPASDIDIMILVSAEEHERRIQTGTLQFFNRELCTYAEGYVDGKYTSVGFLERVAQKGSEPARFAFAGAQVLFSHVPELDELLKRITTYPRGDKLKRIRRFYAQFEAWAWYVGEALRLGNRYLLGVAVSKLVLFGGRLILAHNEALYPYHKWFLRVLADVNDQPAGLLTHTEALLRSPDPNTFRTYYDCVKDFRQWEANETGWANQFMLDSELNWLAGDAPIDDI